MEQTRVLQYLPPSTCHRRATATSIRKRKGPFFAQNCNQHKHDRIVLLLNARIRDQQTQITLKGYQIAYTEKLSTNERGSHMPQLLHKHSLHSLATTKSQHKCLYPLSKRCPINIDYHCETYRMTRSKQKTNEHVSQTIGMFDLKDSAVSNQLLDTHYLEKQLIGNYTHFTATNFQAVARKFTEMLNLIIQNLLMLAEKSGLSAEPSTLHANPNTLKIATSRKKTHKLIAQQSNQLTAHPSQAHNQAPQMLESKQKALRTATQ